MANLARLQQAYNNPNVRRFLDAIASAEGVKHGYNTLFGNQRVESLNAHPNIKKSFKQTDGKTNYTTAAGRYQFIKPTWDGLARQYGFRDFSPQSQDLGAIALIAQNGALDDVMMGRYQNATKKLGRTWASLPSSNYAQPKRSWDQFNKYLGDSSANTSTNQPQFIDLSRVSGRKQPYQPELTSAQDTLKLKGGSYQPEFTSASETLKLKGGGDYQPEFTSAQDTLRLKGLG